MYRYNRTICNVDRGYIMIRNIVFDLGRVLLEYDPIEYINRFNFSNDIKEKLNEIIFRSEYWLDCDKGTKSVSKDLTRILIHENKDLETEISMVINKDWVTMLTLKQETEKFLIELHNLNYRIYILSNLSEDAYKFVVNYDFFKYIDGGVYSYQENLVKPDSKIYEVLLSRYNLIPEETIFIDDSQENIEAANKLKIHGIVFQDINQVKSEVSKICKNT